MIIIMKRHDLNIIIRSHFRLSLRGDMAHPLREARDGKFYTEEEFKEHYGGCYETYWAACASSELVNMPPGSAADATEHSPSAIHSAAAEQGGAAASPAVPAHTSSSPPATSIDARETTRPPPPTRPPPNEATSTGPNESPPGSAADATEHGGAATHLAAAEQGGAAASAAGATEHGLLATHSAAAEQGGAAASSAAPAYTSSLPPEASVAATEHGAQIQRVLLSVPEIRTLALESQKRSCLLHDEARAWLNKAADGQLGDDDARNVTALWPQWSAWLATQPVATSFESDVASFTLSAIPNTIDPNRMGRPRVDYLVHLTDGSNWRFHPGTTKKNSAKPHHSPATTVGNTRVAPEHAIATINAENPWTLDRARQVPQVDRMSKETMWRHVARLQGHYLLQLPPSRDHYIDITREWDIPWWLWVSNLGHRTNDVIGEGIVRALLSRSKDGEAVFTFILTDSRETHVILGMRYDDRLYTRHAV